MASLAEVQAEVNRQISRDYVHKDTSVRSLCVLGLTEEAGEVAGLMKRELRNNFRDKGQVTHDRYVEELGDVLWYLCACCNMVGTSLEEIWEKNVSKLRERYGE